MEQALLLVEEGSSISSAARDTGVPRKTLSDKVSNRHSKSSGGQTALSTEEELALANYCTYMAEHGFPLSITLVKSFAWQIAERVGKAHIFNKETGPGKTWWNEYRKRHHSVLAIRKPDKLDRGRARMANKTVVQRLRTWRT